MKKLVLFSLLALMCACSGADNKKIASPWPVEELMQTPNYEVVDTDKQGVKAIVYESIEYRGAKKKVFSYYSTPGILAGDASLDKNLPAVVCVHGGGGQAFAEWVIMWAERGYAAIAMNTFGHGPVKGEMMEGAYEQRADESYIAIADDFREDWFYNGIADVLAAHSLILSFDEVDTSRTALTGISWGGIMTTLVSGLDHRYKVAVPIYGCGFLYETGSMKQLLINENSEECNRRWTEVYDPAIYVVDSEIPMLYINGTNDKHFFLNQWEKTLKITQKGQRSVRYKLAHGHKPAWRIPEAFAFIDQHLGVREYAPAPSFKSIKMNGNELVCSLRDAAQGYSAYLIYTKSEEINNHAQWVKEGLETPDDEVRVLIPNDYTQWYIAVEYPDKCHYSSEIFFATLKP